MHPFLQQVACHYLKAEGLEDYCFVFPNRRSGQFFIHYLQRELVAADRQSGVPRPHLMPRVTSINDLVGELTRTVKATDIEMLFTLYDAYCQALGDKAQELDKFIYWAQLIVGDFNDIDKALADAGEIYRNLNDQHELSSNYVTAEVEAKVRKIFGENLYGAFFDTSADADLWQHRHREDESTNESDEGKVKQEFISLWNALETIYNNCHKALSDKGVVSPGMQLRMAAENDLPDLPYRRLVFVGFGVLSAAEVKLFDRFKQENKSDFWWDNAGIQQLLEKAPGDPGAMLIKGYCDRFNAKPVEPVEGSGPSLRVVSIPSTVGQAKQAFEELAQMTGGRTEYGIDTAIVLPDESLLVPLLHSVKGVKNLNVTLGYPLRSSGIVSLMHIVARMHHQATKEDKEWTYYLEDVNDILSHPLIKTCFTREALDMAIALAVTNRFRVPAREFSQTPFHHLFIPAMDSEQPGDDRGRQSDYIDNLLAFCNVLMSRMPALTADDEDADPDGIELPLQQAFLVMYIDVLNQLKRSLQECGQALQHGTVFYLIDRIASSAIVPFTGEPLQGLQVMGLLETRSLDFANVVILSMNERVFPRRRSINSFIPNYIRRAHGMSTTEQQEAIVSFNFYRLLNRASHVTLLYDSSVQRMGSSEHSRYITQLEMIYGRQIEHVKMNPVIRTSPAIAIEVPNAGYDDLRSRYLSRNGFATEWYLSASAINNYINCPLLFYIHYIQGLNDDNELSDFMDYSTFGTIVHDVLCTCYSVGEDGSERLITKEELLLFRKQRLNDTVVRFIRKHFLHVPDDRLDTETRSLRGEAAMLVDTIKSYVNFVLDYDIDLIDKSGPFTVLECEKKHKLKELELGGARFNFSYMPDRVDRLSNGTVRIVDYKTGRDETSFGGMDALFGKENGKSDDKRRKAILQLMLYCYAYLKEHPELKAVTPMIYRIGKMETSGVWYKQGRTPAQQYEFSMDNDVAKAFIARMGETINTIHNGSFGQAPENAKCCGYCRFIDFCRRTVPKKY